MFENVIRFTAKVDDRSSHWFLENGTPIETAEKMVLQYIQILGQIKAQQAAQREAQENAEPPKEPAQNNCCAPSEE